MKTEPETITAFQLAFEGYSRPRDTFHSDEEWAIWQHEKLTRIFTILQKERFKADLPNIISDLAKG